MVYILKSRQRRKMITHLTKSWQLNMFDTQYSLYSKTLIPVRNNIKGTKLTIATGVFEARVLHFGVHTSANI